MNDNPSPQNQLIYVPYVPSEVSSQIIGISNDNRHLAVENEKLKNQLVRSQQREQAFAEILEHIDGRTCVLGRNKVLLELMDCEVSSARSFTPQPPLHGDTIYEITMTDHEPLCIFENDFFNDAHLINTFQQHGVRVFLLKSQRCTAALIRQAINKHLTQCLFNNYAGWWSDERRQFTYWIFSGFSTHNPLIGNSFRAMTALPPQTPAVAATAAQQFFSVFEPIHNAFLRQMVFLLYHEAALHSLFWQIGHLPPLSFCLFATDEDILSYLRGLLSWFSDPPIKLDTPSTAFGEKMLFRKDQPLVIEDFGRLDHAKENILTLESALVNKTISWKDKHSTQHLDLQGPIVLLSSRPSSLSIAPEVITLDFSTEDFDHSVWLEIADRISQNQDYLTAFCGYTMEHIAELKNALSEGQSTALHFAGSQLTEDHRKMLGIFIGLQNFLNEFFAFLSVENPPISLRSEDFLTQFAELLVQTSEKAYRSSLAEQFLEVARQYIQSGHFHIYERKKCPQDVNGAVLFDDRYIYFTPQAFFEICHSMAQSRPVILAALAEVDLLHGAQTNATTTQTRTTVWFVHGNSKLVSVYKFDRDVFDDFGTPISWKGELF